MPKKEIDYSNTIIYKIVSRDLNIKEYYVGHTTNFTKRKYTHKSNCDNKNSRKYNYNVYKFIRNHEGFDNWSMLEIEKYDCDDLNEACKRERYWIEKLNASLNKVIPTRTKNEYKEANKEVIKEYFKKYGQENRDDLSAYQKDYKKQNKVILQEKSKIYWEENRIELLESKNIYYEKNKE